MDESLIVYDMQSALVQSFLRRQERGELLVEVHGAILSRPNAIGDGMLLFSISDMFKRPGRTLPVEDLDFRLAHAYDQLLQDKGFSLGHPITVRGELVIREPFGDPRIEPRDLKTYSTPHFSTHYTSSHVELIPRYVHKV